MALFNRCMAPVSTAAEYELVREAIQALTSTSQNTVSFSVDGVQVTYAQSQLTMLQDREIELAKRLSQRNIRKRTRPDFSGGSNTDTLPVI